MSGRVGLSRRTLFGSLLSEVGDVRDQYRVVPLPRSSRGQFIQTLGTSQSHVWVEILTLSRMSDAVRCIAHHIDSDCMCESTIGRVRRVWDIYNGTDAMRVYIPSDVIAPSNIGYNAAVKRTEIGPTAAINIHVL